LNESTEFKGRLRIAGKEINGHDSIPKALSRIKGIGINLAETITDMLENEIKIKRDEKIGNLTDKQLDIVEEMIKNPEKHNIPSWMLNRRKDHETGKDFHLISFDLDFKMKEDKKREIGIKSYRGVRHMFGLKVRGQRTRTTGRKGLTIGVQRKKQQPTKKKKTEQQSTKKKKK